MKIFKDTKIKINFTREVINRFHGVARTADI